MTRTDPRRLAGVFLAALLFVLVLGVGAPPASAAGTYGTVGPYNGISLTLSHVSTAADGAVDLAYEYSGAKGSLDLYANLQLVALCPNGTTVNTYRTFNFAGAASTPSGTASMPAGWCGTGVAHDFGLAIYQWLGTDKDQGSPPVGTVVLGPLPMGEPADPCAGLFGLRTTAAADASTLAVWVEWTGDPAPSFTAAWSPAGARTFSGKVPGTDLYGFNLSTAVDVTADVLITEAASGCEFTVAAGDIGTDPYLVPGDAEGGGGCGWVGIACLVDFFANIDDWVLGLVAPSVETTARWETLRTDTAQRVPFVLVLGPIDWLDAISDPCSQNCPPAVLTAKMPTMVHGVPEATDAEWEIPLSVIPGHEGALSSVIRPLAGSVLYGSIFVGLAMWAWRRYAPGGSGGSS